MAYGVLSPSHFKQNLRHEVVAVEGIGMLCKQRAGGRQRPFQVGGFSQRERQPILHIFEAREYG